jgi:hypothetical protein
MQFSDYMGLLNSLAAEAFTIWGILVTVSLGAIAFIGSVKRLTLPFGLIFSVVFLLFGVFNFLAMAQNISFRENVANTAKQRCPEEYEKNKDLVCRFAMTSRSTSVTGYFTAKMENQVLQGVLIAIVLVILVVISFLRSGVTENDNSNASASLSEDPNDTINTTEKPDA